MLKHALPAELWPVPVQLLSRVMQVLEGQGVAAQRLFSGTPIKPEELGHVHRVLSYTQTIALIERALLLSLQPGLGLDTGLRSTPSDWGVVGYAISCCPTLGEALRLGLRYYRAAPSLATLSLVENEHTVHWIITPPCALGPVQTFLVEEEICAYMRAAKTLTAQELPIREIHFAYPAPAYRQRYAELFSVPLVFSAPCNQIVLDRRALDIPMLQANPVGAVIATELCEQFLRQHPMHSSLGLRIRRYLLENQLQVRRLDSVAEALCMSPRTLRHQLARSGESFQGILDNTRAQLARELLSSSPIKIADAAEQLGYSDARSFRRAFKQWLGQTPGELKAAHHSSTR